MEPSGRNRRQAVLNSLLLREVMSSGSSESEKDDLNDLDEPGPDERPKKRGHDNENNRAQKRAKTNGTVSAGEMVEGGGGLKRKRQAKVVIEEDNADTVLIDVIKHKGKDALLAAYKWVERYEANPDEALRELLTTLFQACGVKSGLEEINWNEIDVDDAVQALVGEAKDEGLEDYLGAKQRDVRNFKQSLISFWDGIIVSCKHTALFDQTLMEKIMDYVIALSCTVHRLFRRVATLVGCQLVTSLVGVGKILGESRETAQRQLNAEKKKRKDGLRMDSLIKILSETHEKITTVEEMMRKLFTGLFMHRYRDVDPEIRMECITAIGSWIHTYPSLFLQDLYLKYIGWTLNDKNALVRRSSLVALQNLYAVDDNIPSLGLFTERFSSRMIELADDIDVTVAVSAIGLLKQLLRHRLLDDDDLGPLYELLIDESPKIRHAIGDLVYDHLIAPAAGKYDENLEGQLERLLQILREFSGDPILCDYVIDALWDKCKAMRDWKCMNRMLLDDRPDNELSDKDATNLVRVVSASVKKAVGKNIVSSSDQRKMVSSKAQKELVELNTKEMTLAMIKSLPKLLTKYLVDPAKIGALVDVILHMKLELFSLNRREQSFATVLHLIKDAFFKHRDIDTLKACVKSLAFAATNSHADLQNSAQQILKETVDDLTSKLRIAIGQAGESDDEYSLTVNLKRLYEVQSIVIVSNDGLFQDMLTLLEEFSNLDPEVARLIFSNLLLHITWLLTAIDPDNPDEAAMSSLLATRSKLMQQLYFALEHTIDRGEDVGGERLLSCTVCFILSDVWTLFSEERLARTKLKSLAFCPPEDVLRQFWKLCENRLVSFDDEDEEVTEGSSAEFLSEKHMIMAAAAKLIYHSAVPTDILGPEILSHFAMHGDRVGQIVEDLIPNLKKKVLTENGDLSWLYLESMKRAYERHLSSEVFGSDEDLLRSPSFLSCKDLATRLSKTAIGPVRAKYVVQGGIDFAFIDTPRQLSFLEAGVLQFALTLPDVDICDILSDIETRVEGVDTDQDPSGWRPFFNFVEVLQERSARTEVARGDREAAVAPRPTRNQRKQKGRKQLQSHDTSSEEADVDVATELGTEDQPDGDDEDDNTPLYHVRQSVRTGKRSNASSRSLDSRIQSGKEAARDTSSPSAENIEYEEHEVGVPQTSQDGAFYDAVTATEEQLPLGNQDWLPSEPVYDDELSKGSSKDDSPTYSNEVGTPEEG